MKRIALLSDTHNYLDPSIVKYFDECDEIWHAGDVGTIAICNELKKYKPLRAVYGNIDGMDVRKEYPLYDYFISEGVSVLITHIGGKPGKYSIAARDLIVKYKPQLFICGHSHILKVMYDKVFNTLYMNPGAAGIHGFHQVKTLLRFTLRDGKIENLQAIELGAR